MGVPGEKPAVENELLIKSLWISQKIIKNRCKTIV